MKQKRYLLALVMLGMIGLGCSVPSFLAKGPTATPVPVKTLRPTFTPMSTATSTVPPTPTPIPTDPPPPTNTPIPPTDTPEPPTPLPPTDTSEPPTPAQPTDTPEPPTPTKAPTKAPQPTTRPQPTKAPQPTTRPQPTKAPPPAAKHVVGSHGVSGLVTARDKTTFAVGEKAFFTYEAVNHTQDPVGFVLLGIKASNGQFNTSWVNPDVIVPGTPFKHDDGMAFNSPGTYKVMLAICFDRCGEADGDWEEFSHGAATITVK